MSTSVDYLRPPEECLALNPPQNDSTIAVTGRPPVRLLYYLVPYTPEEQEQVQQVVSEVASDQDYVFPKWWNDGDTLRFLHEFQFDRPEVVKRIKAHLRFLTSLDTFVITDKMAYILDTGVIYQLGRDNQYRPNVIINLKKAENIIQHKEDFLNAAMYLLVLVREIMLLPYHVERWNLLVECSSISYAFGLVNLLQDLSELIRTNFPQTLERVYMINSRVTEELGHKFNPFVAGYDKRRQIFITNKHDVTIRKYITIDQLERKFGGEIEDLVDDCYPPLATSFLKTGVRVENMQNSNLFYFRMTHWDIFSNMIVQATNGQANPLKVRKEIRYVERPRYKLGKSAASGNSGVSYIYDPTNYWSYQPGDIKLKADYEGDVEVDELGALGLQTGGATSKEYEKKTYIIEQDGVKKIVEEEIETISMPPVIATGASAQNVSILGHDRAKAIKLSYRPVVSDKEKTQIESLDKINLFCL